MEYKAGFYRAPLNNEIGPQAEEKIIEARTKTEAIKTARNLAKQYDWRFLDLIEHYGE